MATKRTKATGGDVPADEPTDAPADAPAHGGPEHDWRNPDVTFADDDHCPNAELARIDRGR